MSTDTLTPENLEEIVESHEPITDVDGEGWIYNVETGEVLGRTEIGERFAIDSFEAADWALELRSKLEGDIAGLNARIKALNDQLQVLKRDKIRRLSWWDYRFSGELTTFARKLIDGTKSKTARFNWGRVSFRATRGSNQIMDMPKAVEFVRTWTPAAVKVVETVQVKDVLAARETAKQVTGEDLSGELPFLITSGPGESVTIATGVDS